MRSWSSSNTSRTNPVILDSRRLESYTGNEAPAFILCPKPRSKSVTPELAKLGEKPITGFDDGSKISDLCALRYPALRDMLLRDHVWAFSKVYVALAALAQASTVEPWEYQFQLPTDCARILSLTVDDQEIEYERVGDILHSLESAADLRYVRNYPEADDGVAWPSDFAEVLANFLAAELCLSITQTQSLRDTYLNQYEERLRQCRFNGAVERTPIVVCASSWIDQHDGYAREIDPRLRGLSGY